MGICAVGIHRDNRQALTHKAVRGELPGDELLHLIFIDFIPLFEGS